MTDDQERIRMLAAANPPSTFGLFGRQGCPSLAISHESIGLVSKRQLGQ